MENLPNQNVCITQPKSPPTHWKERNITKDQIARVKKKQNLPRILHELLELVLDEASSLAQIRSLFEEIAEKHVDYCQQRELRLYLYSALSENQTESKVPENGSLTESGRDQILSYIFAWREEHLILVLESDKLDSGLQAVGNQFWDGFECRSVISDSKKVYSSLRRQYDDKCKKLTSDISADVSQCFRSFQALNKLIQSEHITAHQWTDSEWTSFSEHVHAVSKCIHKMTDLVRRKSEHRVQMEAECRKAIGVLRKEIARVKFAKYDQFEATELNQRRATGNFGQWIRFLTNLLAYSAVLFQNHFNANVADRTEQKLVSLSDQFIALSDTDPEPQFGRIANLIECTICPKLDEYFFFDTLKLHLLVARQRKLYIELWWIGVQLRIFNHDYTQTRYLLKLELDQLKSKLDHIQTGPELIFASEMSRHQRDSAEVMETDFLLLLDEPPSSTDSMLISAPAHVEQALVDYQKSSINYQMDLIDTFVGQMQDGGDSSITIDNHQPCDDQLDDTLATLSDLLGIETFRAHNELLLKKIIENMETTAKLVRQLRSVLNRICAKQRRKLSNNGTATTDVRGQFQRVAKRMIDCGVEMNGIASQTAIHVANAKKLLVSYKKLTNARVPFPGIVRNETDLNMLMDKSKERRAKCVLM